MTEKMRLAVVSGIVAVIVSLISTFGVIVANDAKIERAQAAAADAEAAAAGAQASVAAAKKEVGDLQDQLKSVSLGFISSKPDLDTEWIELPQMCGTKEITLPRAGLPKLVTSYYRLKVSGEIFPVATNQYGDSNQTNGVLLDIDPVGKKIFARLPCGSGAGNNAVHLGWYSARNGSSTETILSRQDVQLRVIVWL